MSFLSILKTVGIDALKVVADVAGVSGVVGVIDPVVTVFNPVAGAVLKKITNVASGVELLIQSDQAAAQKKETAVQIIAADIPQLAEIVQEFGPGATFDQTRLSTAVASLQAAYSAVNEFVASIQKAPPAAA